MGDTGTVDIVATEQIVEYYRFATEMCNESDF